MSIIQRQVLTFLLPLSRVAIGTNNLTDRAIVPMYLSPNYIGTADKKIINKTQTKGGFAVEYWGEDLTALSVKGTTGSGGIEFINILQSIYRHEQFQFRRDILDRAIKLEEETNKEIVERSRNLYGNFQIGDLDGILGDLRSNIEALKSMFDEPRSPKEYEMPITLAAYATSMDMYFQGQKYRGYFSDFNYTEQAEQPGIFEYQFNFVVTSKTGKRTNFMPWHRTPTDASGKPITASVPNAGPLPEELSFQPSTQRSVVQSTFTATQDGTQDPNDVGINRFGKLNE